jgi:hypothetical protein
MIAAAHSVFLAGYIPRIGECGWPQLAIETMADASAGIYLSFLEVNHGELGINFLLTAAAALHENKWIHFLRNGLL